MNWKNRIINRRLFYLSVLADDLRLAQVVGKQPQADYVESDGKHQEQVEDEHVEQVDHDYVGHLVPLRLFLDHESYTRFAAAAATVANSVRDVKAGQDFIQAGHAEVPTSQLI